MEIIDAAKEDGSSHLMITWQLPVRSTGKGAAIFLSKTTKPLVAGAPVPALKQGEVVPIVKINIHSVSSVDALIETLQQIRKVLHEHLVNKSA
jgi:hypothetical protein